MPAATRSADGQPRPLRDRRRRPRRRCDLGRFDEAASLIERIQEWAIDDDIDPQIGWRRLKARLLAHRGQFEEAERVGREAVELAGRGDYIDTYARTLADLGGVLVRAGRPDEASVELAHAVRVFDEKGNVVGAAKAQARRVRLSGLR